MPPETAMNATSQGSKEPFLSETLIRTVADRVGTPFYLYDAAEIRRRAGDIRGITEGAGMHARFAMKACSTRRVLEELRAQGLWIDAVSGNEVLRALRAGFQPGHRPPEILLTADVFRDNALEVAVKSRILLTIGTPEMIDELAAAGHRGPVGVRLNPGFGHGHVKQCDTGGPASKHGIWHEDEDEVRRRLAQRGFPIAILHAHIGTGPAIAEFQTNIERQTDFFLERVRDYPELEAVSFGGGIPHPYRPGAPRIDLGGCAAALTRARALLSERAGRELRVEIEPGRYLVAAAAALVTRVRGLKTTRSNEKGAGHRFVMVDAGFCDLVRPAMYGSYHHIEVLGKEGGALEPQVLAGPLCESGDVFTRDDNELLDPRLLPRAEVGDLVLIRDAGAYGFTMSSRYNSIGAAPQVWADGGKAFLISRRETVEDIIRAECFEEI
jgi:diaminopimelate decarboxylase